MLSDEIIEKVSERIITRIEKVNTDILRLIGNKLDEIGKLTSTDENRLIQMIKYGGDYDKIVKELSKVSKLSKKDIEDIFEEVAKNDYRFAKQFYEYRNIKYIPYDQNKVLKDQVEAITNIATKRCAEMLNPKVLGYGIMNDKTGMIEFKGLKDTYYDLIDEAVIAISQGKQTFDQAMSKRIKQMGGGGLKVIYDSTYIDKNGIVKHRSRRLDSAMQMNIKDNLRDLYNETQEVFGKQFNSDGVEISVHENPAPDHEEAQGRQFSKDEFIKLQEKGRATTYDNKKIDLHRELKNGDKADDFRKISQYNCYHKTFRIVLGVSEPEYSDKELKEIIDRNNEGVEIDGKHYTLYEASQIQRKLETEVRKQKDIQIMSRASGQDDLVRESQQKITQLTTKYKEVSEKSKLPTRMDRMKVSGYHRLKRYDKE